MIGTTRKLMALALVLGVLPSCQTPPDQWPAEMRSRMEVTTRDGTWSPEDGPYAGKVTAKQPFVLFLQHGGGLDYNALAWKRWFAEYGVVGIPISTAQIRGIKTLYSTPENSIATDVPLALKILEGHPGLDFERYAVMGFSKGGTSAQILGRVLEDQARMPSIVFSLYPGSLGTCDYALPEETSVHIFYGDSDDWGDLRGTRESCAELAREKANIEFHLFPGAEHGYDGRWSGTWMCCGGSFKSKPDPAALEQTREIILSTIRERWKL